VIGMACRRSSDPRISIALTVSPSHQAIPAGWLTACVEAIREAIRSP